MLTPCFKVLPSFLENACSCRVLHWDAVLEIEHTEITRQQPAFIHWHLCYGGSTFLHLNTQLVEVSTLPSSVASEMFQFRIEWIAWGPLPELESNTSLPYLGLLYFWLGWLNWGLLWPIYLCSFRPAAAVTQSTSVFLPIREIHNCLC